MTPILKLVEPPASVDRDALAEELEVLLNEGRPDAAPRLLALAAEHEDGLLDDAQFAEARAAYIEGAFDAVSWPSWSMGSASRRSRWWVRVGWVSR